MSSQSVLQWSSGMQQLYMDQVIGLLWKDPRTDAGRNLWLGYPFDMIREQVICKGLADFSVGYSQSKYGDLTADDKVLLYCFVNMRLHFFEALASFHAHKVRLKALFDSEQSALMVDLGCGPGTSGLALAECFKQPNIIYCGLDISRAMLRKSESMLNAAQCGKLLGAKSKLIMTSSWASLARSPRVLKKPKNVLFNGTYLFASDSLDVNDVCNAVMAFRRSANVNELLFLYSNTTTDISGQKFEAFKKQLKGEFATTGLVKAEVSYRNKREGDEVGPMRFVHELLDFGGDV
jgi:SAM-dependent methyltransferase